MHQYPRLNDKIYYPFSITDTAGNVFNASNVNVHVRSFGGSFSAAPTVTLQPDLLTNVGFPDGSYEVLIQLDSANNFETGNTYGVYANAYISSTVITSTTVGSFTIDNPVNADIRRVDGNVQAATNMANATLAVQVGLAEAGTLSTTQMTTDLDEATDNHYINRIITWTSGALFRQSQVILDYENTGGLLTFTQATEAPSAGDSFVIT